MDKKHVYSLGSSCGIVLSAITVHYMMFLGLSLLQIKQKHLTWGTVWMIKANAFASGAEWYNSRYLKTRGRPAYRTLVVSDWNYRCSVVGVCWDGRGGCARPQGQPLNRCPMFSSCFCAASTFDLSQPHANVMMQMKWLPTGNCAIKLGCEALSGFKGNSWWQWNP